MTTPSTAPRVITHEAHSDDTLSTNPDPRTPLTPPDISRSNSASPHHPELSTEVAALSNKLIHAINHQTDLDDTLTDTRHQLEAAQERIRELKRSEQEHRSLVENRILVRWADVENDTIRLRVNLADERKQRVQAENDKKAIELELESLTTALFEEANQMVAAAKKDAQRERELLDRRNEQLQAQLKESETLLTSHQEQLAELKQAMSDLSAPRNDLEAITSNSTAPSTPALDSQEHMSRLFDALNISPTTPGGADIAPAPPTQFSHLICPILRTDVQAFEDFHSLMEIARRSGPPSRVTSGNYSNFSGLGLSNLGKSETCQLSGRLPSNGSTSSLAASNTYQSPSSTPNLPPSSNTSISSRDLPTGGTPLKETAFYKRVLIEDIEPTLRLDTAPGLSWLARRGVISSMCDGKLIVEPMPVSVKSYYQPCSLCGEQSRTEQRARTHRFRTNESETAQRYPLCEYCLNRVRSTCDFLGFLRMVRDGHWRTDGAHAESIAWEESVRLRERMFWSRIGGGVVPAFLRAKPESPRSSTEDMKPLPLPPAAESQRGISNHATTCNQTPLVGTELEAEPPPPLLQNPMPESLSMESPVPDVARSGESLDHATISDPRELSYPESDEARAASEKGMPPPRIDENRSSSSLQRSTTRSRGSNRTEGSGQVINSIAKRAAMFERQASQDAASNQLQQSLQASVKSRSPNGERERDPGPPSAFE